MLEKEPQDRLGTKTGLNEILQHEWLQSIDHCALGEKTIKAPFVPEFENKLDISFFDSVFTKQEIRMTVVDPKNFKLQESFQFLEEFDSEQLAENFPQLSNST